MSAPPQLCHTVNATKCHQHTLFLSAGRILHRTVAEESDASSAELAPHGAARRRTHAYCELSARSPQVAPYTRQTAGESRHFQPAQLFRQFGPAAAPVRTLRCVQTMVRCVRISGRTCFRLNRLSPPQHCVRWGGDAHITRAGFASSECAVAGWRARSADISVPAICTIRCRLKTERDSVRGYGRVYLLQDAALGHCDAYDDRCNLSRAIKVSQATTVAPRAPANYRMQCARSGGGEA